MLSVRVLCLETATTHSVIFDVMLLHVKIACMHVHKCVKTYMLTFTIWEFPSFRGTLFWGPYNKDPTTQGSKLGSPIFGTPFYMLHR